MTATLANKTDKTADIDQIVYGPIEEGDLEELSGLISGMRPYSPDRVRLRDFSADYFHWIYFRNPAGRAYTCCAKHRGRLVSSFVIAPKRVQIGADVKVIGKTMEMYTHPDYQGRGLISKTAKRVFDAARADGIDLWYVTPSANSYPIFVKKWKCVEAFTNNYVIKVLKPSALLAALIRPSALGRIVGIPIDLAVEAARLFSPPPRNYTVREVDRFGPETDALWERSKGYGVALVRDADYLNWRYFDNPDSYIPLFCCRGGSDRAGLVVLKKTIRRGCSVGEIVDFLCPPEDRETRRALLLHGIERLRREGCVFAESWAIEGTAIAREMQRVGLNLKRKKLPVLLSPGATGPEFYDRNAWLLTQGDGNDV